MGFSNPTELCQDLWDLVLHRLQLPSDYVQFSAVCKLWNSIARDHLRRRTDLTGPPMLVTYTGKENTWNLCDMRNQKVLNMQLELPNLRFCGSSLGWLIFMDVKFVVTLINPFSRVIGNSRKIDSEIGLPRLDPPGITERYRDICAKKYEFYVYKAIISADPTLNPKDCIVVVIYGHDLNIAFIRLGEDKMWTYIDANISHIEDVVYTKDKLYAVDAGNQLFCFDITTSQYKFTLVGEGFEGPAKFLKRYLVESPNHKELLMVYRYMTYRYTRHYPRYTKKFKVFKFDASNHKWIKTSTLSDVSLFVGESVMSVIASNFSGCLPNCIYFIHDWDRYQNYGMRNRDYGVYNMTNQKICRFEDASILIKMSKLTPMWTIPTIRL